MAIDEVPFDGKEKVVTLADHSYKSWFIGIAVVLALVVIGEIAAFNKISSLHSAMQAEDRQMHQRLVAQLTDEFSGKLTALENSNAQQLEALKSELDIASKRMGTTGRELGRARKMVADLQQQQEQEANDLKQQLAQKADQQQLGALSQDVSSTKSDLESTKKTVGTLSSDLGMSRSELGTLIARNHDEIEALRKMGQRNYIEFTLTRNQQQTVAGVGLLLKKTNAKRHQFNVNLLADDMEIQKNGRTIDEPIFFAVGGQKGFYELVVNKVEQDKVSGYISTPKFGMEMAAGGTH
jgi:predicted  nucleic acid-binding Zn-ribbon protein